MGARWTELVRWHEPASRLSKSIERVQNVTGRERWKQYTAEKKFRLMEETVRPCNTVSAEPRVRVSTPGLLFE